MRASPTLKRQLLAAAARADRSLSAEMELRLESSFRGEDVVGGAPVAALLQALGAAAVAKFGPDWVYDPNAYFAVTTDLWQEMLVRTRPVVSHTPLPSRPAGEEKQAGSPGSAMSQLRHLVDQINRLLARMLAETASTTPQLEQRLAEIPAAASEEAPAGTPRPKDDG